MDALIAAQALTALQNAASDMRKRAAKREQAVEMYAGTLLFGPFDERGPWRRTVPRV